MNAPEISPWFLNVAGDLSMEEAVGPSGRWRNLSVALWAVHRNDHGIGDPVLGVLGTNRECCLEGNPSYQSDGTCSNGISDYVPVQGPVYLYANPEMAFADWIWDCTDPSYLTRNDPQPPPQTLPGFRALNIAEQTKIRTLITHEFGHLVTSLRMGWADEWTLNASLDGCMADYASSVTSPADWPGQQRRGEFSKEYIAAAVREGYADFYAMWLWNNRNQSDCVLDMWTLHDLDLDCDFDNFFGSGDPRNGQLDCADDWEVATAVPADPTSAYSDGQNWLKDLQTAPDTRNTTNAFVNGATVQYVCATPPAGAAVQCVNDPFTSQSRATIIDFAKFLWKLNQVSAGNVPPEVVTDLYIDACPRGWAAIDEVAFWDPAHPRQRLYLSATENLVSTEVATYDDYFLP